MESGMAVMGRHGLVVGTWRWLIMFSFSTGSWESKEGVGSWVRDTDPPSPLPPPQKGSLTSRDSATSWGLSVQVHQPLGRAEGGGFLLQLSLGIRGINKDAGELRNIVFETGLSVHTVAPATWEAKTGRLLSLGPAWATQQDATPGGSTLLYWFHEVSRYSRWSQGQRRKAASLFTSWILAVKLVHLAQSQDGQYPAGRKLGQNPCPVASVSDIDPASLAHHFIFTAFQSRTSIIPS